MPHTNYKYVSAKKKQEITQPIVSKPPETAAQQPVTDFFSNLGAKAPLLALGALLLIAFIVFKDYIFQEKVYFFKDIGSDSYNLSYPYVYQVADYITKYGTPKWSFNFGMGQSLFPFFLRDPFDALVYLGGKDHILFLTTVKEVLKIVLSGLVFFYYLKMLKLSDFAAIAGSCFFAFCGFTVVGSGWYIFSFEALNMAIMLLAFEQLYQKRKWFLFPFAIFLICISQPFNLYVYGLLLAFYAVLRCLQDEAFNGKKIAILFAQMIGLGALGMLMSSPFMIENIVQLLESPRGSGKNSYASVLASQPMLATADKVQFGTSMMRMFSSDMLGTGNEFKGWQNFLEAPAFYCGIPCLLLVPQVFQFLQKRVKIVFGIFLAIWLLPIIFPWFRYAFWLFTGDYFRAYSVVVAFVLIYYALVALDKIMEHRKISLPVLIGTVVLLFVLLNYPYFADKSIVNSPVLTFVSFMILVYGALVYFMSRATSPAYIKYIFLIAVVFEVTYLSGITVNDRIPVETAELSQKTGYNDYTADAVKYLKQTDNSFYRIDKTYASSPAMHYSLNDAMAQDYRGTSGYNAFNQEYYVFYLQLMGISDKTDEHQARWAMGLSNRPILESQNRVKYMLAKQQVNPLWRTLCDSIATFGDVKVFRSKFLLPFGYTYSRFIRESVFDKLTNIQKDFVSLQAVVVKDEDVKKAGGMKEFDLKDTVAANAFNFDLYRNNVNELSKDSMQVSKFAETNIAGKINVSEDKMLYLSVPYDGGWQLTVDGKPQDKMILSAGMTGVMLPKGQHNVEMTYDLRYYGKGLIIGFFGLLVYLGLWLYQTRVVSKKKKMQLA